jgi:hypothetical protein
LNGNADDAAVTTEICRSCGDFAGMGLLMESEFPARHALARGCGDVSGGLENKLPRITCPSAD